MEKLSYIDRYWMILILVSTLIGTAFGGDARSSMMLTKQQTLVSYDADKRVWIAVSNFATSWRRLVNYDDSDWRLCSGSPGGVGYERDSGYENEITLDVGDQMSDGGTDPRTGCLIRIPFVVNENDLNDIQFLTLKMLYDDGFVAYLNGEKVAEANAPVPLEWDSAATENHESNGSENFVISGFIDRLEPGTNLLAIHGLNISTGSSDFLINAELVGSEAPPGELLSSNLPLFVIDTHGQAIQESDRIIADMGVIDNGEGQRNCLTDPFNAFEGRIALKLRGSSSLGFDKKQYALETQDSLGNNSNVSILGFPEENDWILHGPYSDKTHFRNVLAYKLFNDMGRYATRTKFCELVLNGDYRGLFVFMEKIKRDKNRVAISELSPTTVDGDSLTGGYIIKIDKEDWKPGFVSPFRPFPGASQVIKYQYHYPKEEITPPQERYIREYVTEFETVMDGTDYADPVKGYAKYIDVGSFVDFFLINEISKNIDGYRLSTFMYKDRDSKGGKLTMGPIWDFNLSFGNGNYYGGWLTDGWELDHLDTDARGDYWLVPFYWKRLMDDPVFLQKIRRRWFDLRQDVFNENRIMAVLDSLYTLTEESRARNFEKYDIIGRYIWPNWFVGQSYDEEYIFLQDWISERLKWMDDAIGDFPTGVPPAEGKGIPARLKLGQNYPNPFNHITLIDFQIPESASASLKIINLQGQIVRTLWQGENRDGFFRMQWDGRDDTGRIVAGGIYIYRLQSVTSDHLLSDTKKLLLLR